MKTFIVQAEAIHATHRHGSQARTEWLFWQSTKWITHPPVAWEWAQHFVWHTSWIFEGMVLTTLAHSCGFDHDVSGLLDCSSQHTDKKMYNIIIKGGILDIPVRHMIGRFTNAWAEFIFGISNMMALFGKCRLKFERTRTWLEQNSQSNQEDSEKNVWQHKGKCYSKLRRSNCQKTTSLFESKHKTSPWLNNHTLRDEEACQTSEKRVLSRQCLSLPPGQAIQQPRYHRVYVDIWVRQHSSSNKAHIPLSSAARNTNKGPSEIANTRMGEHSAWCNKAYG